MSFLFTELRRRNVFKVGAAYASGLIGIRRASPPLRASGEREMEIRAASMCLALLTASYASPLMSHHGNVEFDLNARVSYEGGIREYMWRNPHSVAILETQTESGEPILLEIEGSSPSLLRTIGLTATSIIAGDYVKVVVSPSRRFPNESAYGHELVKEDGSIVALTMESARERGRQTNRSASSIFATWVADSDAFRRLVRARNSWTFTEKGQALFDSYSPVMSPQAQCVPTSSPWLMAYGAVMVFERLPDRVLIKTDWMGAERTIFLDGREHPPVDERFPQGHSIGWWEGDVLAVDTTNFTDQLSNRMYSGAGKRLVERFALSEDGKSMSYTFVMEDPEHLTDQVSGGHLFNYRPDLELSGMECDLENAERFLREFR